MADSLSANATGKAAVVVIDNQFGLGNIGVRADHLDEIWRQITQGLLGKRYDEVVIILGHHPGTENNPIVNALSAATKRFGAVKIAKKMGSKTPDHDTDGEYNRVVIAAFLFDKGMLTADEARALSADWIREYKKPGMSWGDKFIDGFDHEPVLRKIHGLPVK